MQPFPLPEWEADPSRGYFQATAPDGRVWTLRLVAQPCADDPFPPGWRLAPADDPGAVNYLAETATNDDFQQASVVICGYSTGIDTHGQNLRPGQVDLAAAWGLRFGADPATTRAVIGLVIQHGPRGNDQPFYNRVSTVLERAGYDVNKLDMFRMVYLIRCALGWDE